MPATHPPLQPLPDPGTSTRLRIDLAYDGGPFNGFARQPDVDTVQDRVEDALRIIFGHDVASVCAGRTDRGVHALAQVVHVDVAASTPRGRAVLANLASFRERLDHMVEDAISIWRISIVDETFHARFSASWRFYRYRLIEAPADPRRRTLVWHVKHPFAIEPMAAALPAVLGEHDFTSFCREAVGKSRVRTVLEAAVGPGEYGETHVTLRGTAFCHQQVRAVVGSLLEVGAGRRDPAWFAEIIAARDRNVTGPVAPPQGLTLESVGYAGRWPDAPWHNTAADRAVAPSG